MKAYLAEPGLSRVLRPTKSWLCALGHELREELSRLEPRDAGPLGGVAQPVGEEPTSAQRRHADLDDVMAGLADRLDTAAPKTFWLRASTRSSARTATTSDRANASGLTLLRSTLSAGNGLTCSA